MGTLQPVASSFLTRILHEKQDEVAARRQAEPDDALRRRAAAAPPPLPALDALRGPALRVIAEVKRASPSAGTFGGGLDAAAQAARYAGSGAAAVSVLTDAPFFQGSLEDLAAARCEVAVPLLRKDFIIDGYQVYEARAAGADLVLLIVAALAVEEGLRSPQSHRDTERDGRQSAEAGTSDRSRRRPFHPTAGGGPRLDAVGERLAALLDLTHELGMEAMVEVNTPEEARLAAAVGASLVGINNRDLHTFIVDMETMARLRPLLPPEMVVAALSGVRTAVEASRMRAAGADAVLVGEALVRAADPAALIAAMTAIL